MSNNATPLTGAEERILAARWQKLWPADQRDILAAVQCLPAERQSRATYEMAFRFEPMPELEDFDPTPERGSGRDT
jgi:hypothetical protein